MKSNEYTTRRTFCKYDREHYLVYLNEKEVVLTDPNTEVTESRERLVKGYSYEGDLQDGGTLIHATDVNETNIRDKFISGLIRKKYPQDKVEAVILNGDDTDEHVGELNRLQFYRRECKDKIDELLAR